MAEQAHYYFELCFDYLSYSSGKLLLYDRLDEPEHLQGQLRYLSRIPFDIKLLKTIEDAPLTGQGQEKVQKSLENLINTTLKKRGKRRSHDWLADRIRYGHNVFDDRMNLSTIYGTYSPPQHSLKEP